MFHATTRVTLLSDKVTEDEFGDEVDAYDASASNVRAHIAEQARTVFDPQSGRVLTVRNYLALLPSDAKVDRDWRVKDERSGVTYFVEHVERPPSFIGGVPTRVEMRTVE